MHQIGCLYRASVIRALPCHADVRGLHVSGNISAKLLWRVNKFWRLVPSIFCNFYKMRHFSKMFMLPWTWIFLYFDGMLEGMLLQLWRCFGSRNASWSPHFYCLFPHLIVRLMVCGRINSNLGRQFRLPLGLSSAFNSTMCELHDKSISAFAYPGENPKISCFVCN